MPGHVVFVRFFPNASGTFPYDHFADLPDEAIPTAVESLRKTWWGRPTSRRAFQAWAREADRRRLESDTETERWSQGWVAKPGQQMPRRRVTPPKPTSPPAEVKRRVGPPTFDEIAVIDGWRSGMLIGWEMPYGISRRYAVAKFGTKGVAEAVAEAVLGKSAEIALTARASYRSETTDPILAEVNPRFTVVAETKLSPAERLLAGDQIRRLDDPGVKPTSLEAAIIRAFWRHSSRSSQTPAGRTGPGRG